MVHWLRSIVYCILVWGCLITVTHARGIVLVSSDASGNLAVAEQSLLFELEQAGIAATDVLRLQANELTSAHVLADRWLVIAMGVKAFQRVSEFTFDAPVLAALIPRISYERIARDAVDRLRGPVCALYLDQPFGRQLNLLTLALPTAKNVGVLWGSSSVQLQPLLQSALQARTLQEVSAQVNGIPTLQTNIRQVVMNADVLLAVADPEVFNSNTITPILLATYRERIPMLAFSPAYVKAGALMSVHTSPEQIGRQAGGLARSLLLDTPLQPGYYPAEFSVSVNQQVARSLGLTLDASALSVQLKSMEKTP